MQALLYASNADERAVLQLLLQRTGLSTRIAQGLEKVIEEWPDQVADLIVLAFRKEFPVAFTRQLRALTAVPVVIISDPISEDLHADLFDAGADLVVLRPYSARILIMEIRAVLRRTTGVPFFTLPSITRGDISLDPTSRNVQVRDGAPKQLTQLEFRLLYTMMMHPDQVFPAERLVEHVWGYSGRGDRDLVRGLIRRLRIKVEPEPRTPNYIITVPRVGYVLKYES